MFIYVFNHFNRLHHKYVCYRSFRCRSSRCHPEIPNPSHPFLARIPTNRAISSSFHRTLQRRVRGIRQTVRRPRHGASRTCHQNHRMVLLHRLVSPELRRHRWIRGCPHREEILITRGKHVFQGDRPLITYQRGRISI